MMFDRLLSAALIATVITGLSVVCIAAAQTQSAARGPSPQRGAVIAAQGTLSGAPACAQCHAFNGVSDGSGAFPRIAGQSAYYLAKQLRDFTSGIRVNAIMTPVAGALTADDIADVAAYFAGIEAPFLPLQRPDSALITQGAELAKVGSAANRIQACNNCHGINGAGEPPAISYLAGQYASYIALEWRMWRRGFRKSSPGAMACLAENSTTRRSRQQLPITSRSEDCRGLCIAVGDFMSTDPDVPHTSSAGLIEHVATPIDADSAAETLKDGARGAFVVAGIAVGLLFIGWLAFYFLLFLPRGSVG